MQHVRILIVGSGFGGIGAAIRLKQRGIHDFVIVERAGELGGVWRDNTYPGCACDVESHLYSFSFAPNPEWSRTFSGSAEIKAYLQGCAERFGITPHLRFDHDVLDASWDDGAARWIVKTSKGDFSADVLVGATGALSDPQVPSIPGLDRFEGTWFHSARWNHDYALEGKRVAVIGTGASAVQFVPAIQPQVEKLLVFQRTPPWIMPRRDRAIAEHRRAVLRRSRLARGVVRAGIYAYREVFALPFLDVRLAARAEALAKRHLARSVRDPALRAKLTPAYRMGCKRILLSDDYLPALTKANVDVVTDGIREITKDAIVTTDGTRHRVDAVVFGTGFMVQDLPIAKRIHGKDGRTLKETWAQNRMQAHLGTTVAGFPNLFVLLGPNTGLGHSSVLLMIESQIEHLLDALHHLDVRGLRALEPKPEAQAAFVAGIDRRMAKTVWTQGGCSSWYLDASGRNSTLWPGFTFSFKRRVERFDASEYTTRKA